VDKHRARRLVYFAATIFIGWLAVILLWEPSILVLTADDSFYYLLTARNAALGYGFSFDQLNATNGFHPLWMYALTPLAWMGSGDMALFARIVLAIQLLMIGVGAFVLDRTLDQRGRLLAAVAILMVNFYYTKVLVNGLESAVQWVCLCGTVSAALNIQRRPLAATGAWQYFGLGLLIGLTVLARLTAVYFGAAVLATTAVIFWQAEGASVSGAMARRLAIAVAGAAILVVPYLANNSLSTGHLMPVSAAIKTSRPSHLGPTHVVAAAALLAIWIAGCRLFLRARTFTRTDRDLAWASFPILTYMVLQAQSDILIRGVLVTELWYMVPQALLAMLALGEILRRAAAGETAWRWTGALGACAAVVFAALTWTYRVQPSSYSAYTAGRETADWLREHTPQNSIVAAWDAGVIAGFCDRRLVNLDGLINSWQYKAYLDEGHTQQWIQQVQPVDYIAQYFWDDQLNARAMRDYRGVNLLEWNVAYARRVTSKAWSNMAQPREITYLVLGRRGGGVSLADYLVRQPPTTSQKQPPGRS
jgi:hypothetical protein